MKQLGVTELVSLSAVGSLEESVSPGTFVIVDQFVDKTYLRKKTFFEKGLVYKKENYVNWDPVDETCLLYTSPSPRDS